MAIAKRPLTVGNNKRYTLNYGRWLPEGVTIVSQSVSASSANVTISNVTIKEIRLNFFVTATTVNETFTVSVQITDSIGQVKNDTLEFTVVPA